ncbi:hypothetical protein ACP179_00450 (plasmid) [Xenorhabdus stockiae]|uniref:hypothetical protein n=1 Tax=Xenorhabdus stockiae TaxID=351614 RepID=UPI003CEDC921
MISIVFIFLGMKKILPDGEITIRSKKQCDYIYMKLDVCLLLGRIILIAKTVIIDPPHPFPALLGGIDKKHLTSHNRLYVKLEREKNGQGVTVKVGIINQGNHFYGHHVGRRLIAPG